MAQGQVLEDELAVAANEEGEEPKHVGTWEIASEGRICRTWNSWDGRRRRCYVVYKKDDGWDLDIPERLTRFTLQPAPAD